MQWRHWNMNHIPLFLGGGRAAGRDTRLAVDGIKTTAANRFCNTMSEAIPGCRNLFLFPGVGVAIELQK